MPPPPAASRLSAARPSRLLIRSCTTSIALQRKPLKEGIANFYDESSSLWESIWVRLLLTAIGCLLCFSVRAALCTPLKVPTVLLPAG